MNERFNIKGTIDWPALDRRLIADWFGKAESSSNGAEQLVFAWIVFNHYYSAYAAVSQGPLKDRERVLHFAKCSVISKIWDVVITLKVSNAKLLLPLSRIKKGKTVRVPDGIAAGEYAVNTLTPEQYLDIVYQIRCEYFHANRGTRDFRDQLRTSFAGPPLFDLVKLLIRETSPS